jgi:hypothetical protein
MENNQPTTIEPTPTPTPAAPIAPIVAPAATNGQKHGFMPKKTLIFIAVLAIITISLLAISLIQKTSTITQLKSVISKSEYENAVAYAQSNLSLSTPITSTTSAYTSNVEITTGNDKVTGVDVRLSYDPQVLGNVDIKPGAFFANPVILLKKIDPIKGLVTYTIAVNPSQKSAIGKGTVAMLSFSQIAASASTQINFLPETEVTAVGYASSVLNTSSNLTFTTK